MTVWDFADHHATAFVLCVMFAAWGFAAGVNGIFRVAFKVTKAGEK